MAKILVVDDDVIIQQIILRRLHEEGYDVIIAADGNKGVALAQSAQPDIILMDLRLPYLNGWEATRQIKASLDVPIIALTGAATAEERQLMLDAGCEGYVIKPVNFTELFTQIDALLS